MSTSQALAQRREARARRRDLLAQLGPQSDPAGSRVVANIDQEIHGIRAAVAHPTKSGALAFESIAEAERATEAARLEAKPSHVPRYIDAGAG